MILKPKKIYGTHLLNSATNKDAVSNKSDVVLYNCSNLDNLSNQNQDIHYLNTSKYRFESSWWYWNKIEKLTEKINTKKKGVAFKYNDYDFSLAVKKLIFWAQRNESYFIYIKETKYKNDIWAKNPKIFSINLIKILFLFTKKKLEIKNYFHKKDCVSIIKADIGILIEHQFQFGLYKSLLEEICLLDTKNRFVVFVLKEEVYKLVLGIGFQEINVIQIRKAPFNFFNVKLKDLIKGSEEERYCFNLLLNSLDLLNYYIYVSEVMSKFGIKKVLLNEAENGVKGAVICEIMRNKNIITYNTMNGIKAPEAQNANINFDKWFVWDIEMKNMLIKECKLPKNKLIVSGHLRQDQINKFTYDHSYNFLIQGNYSKVISFFSTSGDDPSKFVCIQALIIFLEKASEVLLLVRLHPLEEKTDIHKKLFQLQNVRIVDYDKNDDGISLYNQIYLSDLAICIASTIALECKWMNVKCVSFELLEKSSLYCIDDKTIYHVSDVKSLNDFFYFNNTLEKKIKDKTINIVAKKIMSELLV